MVYTKLNTFIKKYSIAWVILGLISLCACTSSKNDLEETVPAAQMDTSYWSPSPGDHLQIQYTDYPVDINAEADIFAIDLFETPEAAIQQLHSAGKKVICYISTGSWEDYRPDKDAFPENAIGKDYEGWPGEKWLDISRYEQFAEIMLARFDLAKSKDCDGIDADNMQNYQESSGFDITSDDQLAYNRWLSAQAHQRGLSIGLKNDAEQANTLAADFDWSLIEDCSIYDWCDLLQPFIEAGKPVFQVEYTDNFELLEEFCPQADRNGYMGILKNRELDAWVESCR
jgi:hypothetical protein